MEEQHQAVGHPLVRPDDEHVQVDGDGDGPEERAAVGESGHGTLGNAARRVAAEDAPHAVAIGDGREQVRHRQEEQQPARGGPQVGPRHVGQYDERGARERQGARAQHQHLLGEVNDRLVAAARHGFQPGGRVNVCLSGRKVRQRDRGGRLPWQRRPMSLEVLVR